VIYLVSSSALLLLQVAKSGFPISFTLSLSAEKDGKILPPVTVNRANSLGQVVEVNVA